MVARDNIGEPMKSHRRNKVTKNLSKEIGLSDLIEGQIIKASFTHSARRPLLLRKQGSHFVTQFGGVVFSEEIVSATTQLATVEHSVALTAWGRPGWLASWVDTADGKGSLVIGPRPTKEDPSLERYAETISPLSSIPPDERTERRESQRSRGADLPHHEQQGGEHYEKMPLQPFDVIDLFNLDFYAGNCVKYILRAGRKSGVSAESDIKKALHYLQCVMDRLPKPEEAVKEASPPATELLRYSEGKEWKRKSASGRRIRGCVRVTESEAHASHEWQSPYAIGGYTAFFCEGYGHDRTKIPRFQCDYNRPHISHEWGATSSLADRKMCMGIEE